MRLVPSRAGLAALLHRHGGWWLALFLAPIALVRLLQIAERLGPPLDPVVLFDARAYLEAAARAAEGGSLYLPLQLAGSYPASGLSLYLYPPLFGQLLAPIAGFDHLLLGALFVVGSFAGAVLALRTLARSAGSPWLVLVGAVAALLLIPGGFTTLVTANIEYALIALLALFLRDRAHHPRRSGAIVALLLLWKPLLFPLGLYLIARRDRRAITGALVTGGAGVVLSLAIGGIEPWIDYLHATANLTGLGLMGVTYSASELLRPLTGAATLPLLALLLTLLLARITPRAPLGGLLVAVVGGIFAAPLVWGRYLLLLLPFLFVAREAVTRWALLAAIAIGTIEPRIDGSDHPLLRLAVTLGVLGSLAIAARRLDRRPITG